MLPYNSVNYFYIYIFMNHSLTTLARHTGRIAALGIFSVSFLSLAGCTLGKTPPIVPAQEQASIDFSSDEGSGSINLGENGISFSGEDGSTTATIGQGLPDNWPSDLPTPEADIAFSGSTTEEDGATTFSAVFSSSESADAMLSFLKSQFTAAGWSVEGDYNASYSGTISAGFSATKADNTASILIGSDSSDPGQLTVTIGAEYR